MLFSLSCGNEFTREDCKTEFDLCDCEQESAPAPGPVVDLEPDPENTSTLHWVENQGEVNERVIPPTGTSVFENDCEFRKDFLGYETLEHAFTEKVSGNVTEPLIIEVQNADGSIVIRVFYSGRKQGLTWIVEKTTAPKKLCVLQKGPVTSDLPAEFANLQANTLMGTALGEEWKFKVEFKKDPPSTP
jgi:hypothetical protein